MSDKKLLRLKGWFCPESMIFFQIVFVLFERFFIQLGIPSMLSYMLDIANIFIMANLLVQKKSQQFILSFFMYIYFSLAIGSSLIAFFYYPEYGNNLLFTVLVLRNLLRFPLLLIAVIKYIKVEAFERIFQFIEVHYFVNAIFIIIQYLTYFPVDAGSMRGDLLNGFFGTMRGGNSFVNVELIIIVFYVFIKWHKKETSVVHLMIVMLTSCMIAGIIELKAFFIELILGYGCYLLFVPKSAREIRINLIVISMSIITGSMAIKIMLLEYPWFQKLLSFQGLWEEVTAHNYSSANDLNRLTGFITIKKIMFQDNPLKTFFGIGLGNGSASHFLSRTTEFAKRYSSSNYSWFHALYLYVQCGLVGLFMYLSTFFVLLIKGKYNKLCFYTDIMLLLTIFLVFYNETLKTDAGYLVYFAIAAGFLKEKKGLKLEGDSYGIINNYTCL